MRKFILIGLVVIGCVVSALYLFDKSQKPYNPYGVGAHLTRWEFNEADKELSMMREAGMSICRSGVEWGKIETGKNQYNFQVMDSLVSLADKNDIEFLSVIPGSCVPKYAQPFPLHIDELAEFGSKIVARYKGKIRYWEMVNEPDGLSFWGGLKPNPVEYRTLIKKMYPAIKKANPNAVVLYGGLSGTPLQYMEETFRDGGANCFDVMNVHPYSFQLPPEDRLLIRLNETRAMMEKYGIGDKPIWITEIGYASAKPNPSSIQYIDKALKICGIDASKIAVGHLGDEKYNFYSDALTGDVFAVIPNAKSYRRFSFQDLKNLSVEESPMLFIGENQAFPYNYLDDLRSYVAKGGVVVASGGVPFYYDIRISKKGNPYQVVVNTKALERFRIGVKTKDDKDMAFVNKHILDKPVVRGDVSTKESAEMFKDIKPIGHYRGKFFASDYLCGKDDKFIPILYGVFGDKKIPLGAIYKYGGDMKGAFIVLLSKGKEYVSEKLQGELLPRQYILARSAGVERIFKYNFRSHEFDYSRESHFGMIRRNLERKPAYFAYKTLTEMMGTAIPKYRKLGSIHIAEWIRDDGMPICAIWKTMYSQTISLKFEGKVDSIKNHLNEDTKYTLENGNISLQIDGSVRYIIGIKNVEVLEK